MKKKIRSFTEMYRCKTLISLCIATAIIAWSCTKSGSDQYSGGDGLHVNNFSDTTTPVVEIYTPIGNQVFSSGDTIKIDGKVTDNGLYRGSIQITNDANGAVVKEQLYEIHGYQLYNFHLEQRVIVNVSSNYTITVQYEDHGLNNGVKSVKVVINP